MKVTDLRIGNYIMFKDARSKYIEVERHYLSSDIDQFFKPIPITADWLLKFGFTSKSTVFENYEIETFFIPEAELTIGFSSVGRIDVNFKEVEIKVPKYVHQLQNLYFALTGDELTIKK